MFNQAPHRVLLLHQSLSLHQLFLHLVYIFNQVGLMFLFCALLSIFVLITLIDGHQSKANTKLDVLIV